MVPAGTSHRAAQTAALAAAGVDDASLRTPSAGGGARRPGRSCGARASRCGRARSTSRTAACSRSPSPPRVRSSRVSPRSRTTRTRIGARSRRRSRRTSSSARVASRSARTTSCARSPPSSAVEELFWGVAMRPGKPLSFAMRGATLVFGLPGNPVSALVGATLFVVPALRALQGAASVGPPWQSACSPALCVKPAPRRLPARTHVSPRGRRARARHRPGVAHDRSRCRGGRARPRPARRRRAPAGARVRYVTLA